MDAQETKREMSRESDHRRAYRLKNMQKLHQQTSLNGSRRLMALTGLLRLSKIAGQDSSTNDSALGGAASTEAAPIADTKTHNISVRLGLSLVTGFLGTLLLVYFGFILTFIVSFVTVMVFRGVLNNRPRPFDLFSNMYLAGTIIFGGGPVVIPLLRSYIVDPGWVSPRDFLLGLAIIQAFPGPKFNFAVYLGALALASTGAPTILGELLGYVGIFAPGIILAVGVQSVW